MGHRAGKHSPSGGIFRIISSILLLISIVTAPLDGSSAQHPPHKGPAVCDDEGFRSISFIQGKSRARSPRRTRIEASASLSAASMPRYGPTRARARMEPIMSQRVLNVEGSQPDGEVFQGLGKDTPEPEHDARRGTRVPAHARHELAPALDHPGHEDVRAGGSDRMAVQAS